MTAPDSVATLPQTKTASAIRREGTKPMASGRRSSVTSAGVAAGRISFEGGKLLFRTTTEAVMLEIAPAFNSSTDSGPNRMEQDLLQHLVFRTERAQLPCIEHGDMIDGVQRTGPMRNDKHDAITISDALDRG